MNARKTGQKQQSTKSNGLHASQQTETACAQKLYKATFHVNFHQFPLFKQTFCMLSGNATAQQKD